MTDTLTQQKSEPNIIFTLNAYTMLVLLQITTTTIPPTKNVKQTSPAKCMKEDV